MRATEVIKEAAHKKGLPTTHIGPMIGKGANYFSAIDSRGSTPKADTLAAMLKPCGYKLAAIPEDELPESALVIDPAE